MARTYKLFVKARIVFYAFCLIFMGLALCQTAYAAKDPVFTVQGVKVDVTADSAAAAREQAFTEAQNKAFQVLLERLLSADELSAFAVPETSVISTMIKDFEITDERLSSIRYIGTYTFRFQNDAVRSYIGSSGVSYTDVGSKPVLVLPFFEWGSRTILWGENNPWMGAWNRQSSYQGLVPILLPIGDLDDVSDIGDNQALTYSEESLVRMVSRYRAGEAIIMLAAPGWHATEDVSPQKAPDTVDITIYRTDRKRPEVVRTIKVSRADQRENESIYDAGVRSARLTLQEDWKNRTLVNATQDNNLVVRVRFNSVQEWVNTQKTLERVQGVQDIDLLSLTPSEARLKLIFQGTERRLRLALAQADMTLTAPQLSFGSSANPYIRPQAGSPLVYDLYLNKYRPYQ